MRSPFTVSAYLAVCLAVGIVAAHYSQTDAIWCPPATIGLLVLLWRVKKRASSPVFWILAGLGIGLLGFWRMAATLPGNRPLHFQNVPNPTQIQVRILEPLRQNDFSKNYVGAVVNMDERPAEGKLLLRFEQDDTTRLLPGQQLLTTLLPKALSPPLNPGQFDYRAYLEQQDIHGQLKLPPDSYMLLPGVKRNATGLLQQWRHRLLRNLEATGLSPEQLGVAKALLLGDRRQIDPALYGDYRKAGALHLLAVSGLHVGILAAFVFGLLSFLRRIPGGRTLRLIMGTVLLWGYAGMAGFSPSVVRAVILYSVVAYALFRERPGQTLHFLAIAWIFMLSVLNPKWLFQAGFQLSFAAVSGIVVFFPTLYRLWPWRRTPLSYIGKLLAVSMAAQAATLPLTLFYFHQFPGLFLISNLLLLPGIGLVLSLGFLCLLLQTLNLLPAFLITAYDTILGGMNQGVGWIARRGAFHWDGIPWDLVQLICGGLALTLLGMYLGNRKRHFLHGAVACLLALQMWDILEWDRSDRRQALIIPHKVGQTAVWVRQGRLLQAFSSDSAAFNALVRDARIPWRVEDVNYKGLQHSLRFGGLFLRMVDSSGLYAPQETVPDILLISGSPRIHLDRLLERWGPGQVVADGSNYYSLLEHRALRNTATNLKPIGGFPIYYNSLFPIH